jgi:hypothetical protein
MPLASPVFVQVVGVALTSTVILVQLPSAITERVG